MWPLIKAEIEYNQRAIAFAFSIAILVSIIAGSISLNESERAGSALFTTGFLSVIMVIYLFLLIHLGSQDSREKRDRLHSLLPVTIKQHSLERLLVIVLLQSGFAVLFLLGSVGFNLGIDSTSLFYILSSQAVFFSITMLMAIYQDLGHFGTLRYRLFYIGLFFALIGVGHILVLFDSLVPVLKFIFEPYLTATGAALYTLIAIGLFFLSAKIFTRRRVYLV